LIESEIDPEPDPTMPARTFNALSNYMDLLLDAICVVDTDGNFVYVSAGCERIFGYTQQELIGQPMISLVHPDDRQATLQAAADVMEGVKLPHFENRYIRKDGSTAHIMWSARWSEDDRLRIAVARDVTGRKQIEARQQAMYAIAETSYSATDLQDLARKVEPIVQTILPDQGFRIELHQAATHDTSFSCKVKNRSALKAGELALLHFVETQIAIVIERHQLLNRLQHLALYDSLTELPNRQLFHDRMTSAISRAERNGSKLAVFFIDLDNFKAINDTYGHDVGDMTLRQVARRLQTCIRGSDTAARLAGDEFVVLLESMSGQVDTRAVADKILAELSRPFSFEDLVVEVTPSIGIAYLPDNGFDRDTLLRHADQAMYSAKKDGGGRIHVAGPGR
tara:strand:+ start:13993 stop:15177 length:1185 start_codon:yes stop_codon:yes gene_type:complete